MDCLRVVLYGAFDDFHQIEGGGNRLVLSAADDGSGNLRCVALLAVLGEDASQLLPGPAVDNVFSYRLAAGT